MKLVAATVASLCLSASASAQTQVGPMRAPSDIGTVAPALEKYTQERLLGDVWKRPGLSARDRSAVTFAALIARNLTIEMPYRSEEHTSELQSPCNLVCRLLLEKKKTPLASREFTRSVTSVQGL